MSKIGYVVPGTNWEPEPAESRQVAAPESLLELRKRIAQMTVFFSTARFAKMRKTERLEMTMDYNQMVVLETEFSAALSGQGVTNY